ncbi:MAG: hypothetical protein U5J98_04975 [Halobacteriales archaeon]|nr:hypothetical protein [Halobacteriales archaeon]
MSVSGLCQLCQSAPAKFRCGSCGALVCDDHYVPGVGRCTDCAGPDGGRQL